MRRKENGGAINTCFMFRPEGLILHIRRQYHVYNLYITRRWAHLSHGARSHSRRHLFFAVTACSRSAVLDWHGYKERPCAYVCIVCNSSLQSKRACTRSAAWGGSVDSAYTLNCVWESFINHFILERHRRASISLWKYMCCGIPQQQVEALNCTMCVGLISYI